MPTYDYLCDACEHSFEEFQSMSDPVLQKCPGCGKRKLRRLFGTGAGIIFKGSGFYETDYRRKNGMKEGRKAEADAKGGEGKAESKPDSKAESKSDPKPESKPDPKPVPRPASKPGSPKSPGKKD